MDAFPWDNRVRPDFQLRLNFNEFAGIRGGQVTASIGWTLLNQRGDKIIASGKVDRKIATGSSDVEVYVKSLNQLLNSSVELIAAEIAGYLTVKLCIPLGNACSLRFQQVITTADGHRNNFIATHNRIHDCLVFL